MKVPLLNFIGGPGTPLLNFEGGPGVPLLNFRGLPGLGSQGPEVLCPGVWVPLLHHAIHILPNISGSKGAQKTKLDPLIEHNIEQNHTQNVVEKLFPDYFLKNLHLVQLWINSLKSYTIFFSSKYSKTKLQITWFDLI